MYWDHFQETPPVSSYLVAFFVGDFHAIKTQTIGVYARKSYVSQAEYIANKSPMLLRAMEEFTGVKYSLPKLDLLAIPDFAAGAMENWGLNTYRYRTTGRLIFIIRSKVLDSIGTEFIGSMSAAVSGFYKYDILTSYFI